ncbi:MAG TPA: hypothetical protein VEC37_07095, partial [Bacillota bacterium]|nr:hypothetical protein [Bacillota bacterium]
MKRFGILLLVCALLVVGTVVFAEERTASGTNDGIVVWSATSSEYSNTKLNRTAEVLDENGSGQLAQVNVTMRAFIPCYLRMEFNGNDGKTIVESFGPQKDKTNIGQAVADNIGYNITFDNEIGGFVDKD